MPCAGPQAVIGTCSCKKDRTFGELLDSYIASHPDMVVRTAQLSACISTRCGVELVAIMQCAASYGIAGEVITKQRVRAHKITCCRAMHMV